MTRTIVARFVERPVAESDFENEIWQHCQPITINHYWSGEPAPASRHAEARICWSNEALHVRFVGAQQEPLVVSENPVTDREDTWTLGPRRVRDLPRPGSGKSFAIL